MRRHPGIGEFLAARAGLVAPAEAKRIRGHYGQCHECFVKAVRYAQSHYQEAKEYATFGFLEELGEPVMLPADLRAALKEDLAGKAPSLLAQVRSLKKGLAGAGLLGDKLRFVLRGFAWQAGIAPRRHPDLWPLAWDCLNAVAGTYSAVDERFRKAFSAVPADVDRFFQVEGGWPGSGRVPWRLVSAALPPRVRALGGATKQRQHFQHLERVGISLEALDRQFRRMAHESDVEVLSSQHAEHITSLLAICAATIGKLGDLRYVTRVQRSLRDYLGVQHARWSFRRIRTEKVGLGSPVHAIGQSRVTRTYLSQWLSQLPGRRPSKTALCLLPDVVGVSRDKSGTRPLAMEVRHCLLPEDIISAKRLLCLFHVERFLLVSRLPLKPAREWAARHLDELRDSDGNVRVLLFEWDEDLDSITDCWPPGELAHPGVA